MKTHFDNLAGYVPDLASKQILDLGSGRGAFLIEAARRGAQATGLEPYNVYVEKTLADAALAGVSIKVEQGVAEALPFPNGTFDFINISEVIEHIENPDRMLEEIHRVLKPDGWAYISVPNRFGLKDQHFHLYFVNWLPRSVSDLFIGIFGTHKDYEAKGSGRQRLADMHYYTFARVHALISEHGFDVSDIRLKRIARMPLLKRIAAQAVYPLARALYLDSFHFLLQKRPGFMDSKQVR